MGGLSTHSYNSGLDGARQGTSTVILMLGPSLGFTLSAWPETPFHHPAYSTPV